MLISQNWLDMGGGLWPLNGTVKKILVSPLDSNIYVGGGFSNSGDDHIINGFGFWDKYSRQWNQLIYNGYTGSCKSFDFYSENIYYSGVIVDDGEILGAGIFTKIEEQWLFVSDGPNDDPISLKTVDDKLYCLGGFDQVGDLQSYGIGIYDGEGFTSINVDPSPSSSLMDANDAILFNDQIYITGKNLSGFPNHDWRCFAKIEDEELVVAHEEFTGSFSLLWVYGMEIYQDKLMICGNFNQGIGFTGNGIQAFDGENMFQLPGGPNKTVNDMKVYKGELYVVGDFNQLGTSWTGSGGVPCEGIAKWNGETWTCLNTVDPAWGRFTTLEIWEDTLYVGGDFRYLGGDTALTHIARKRIYPDTTLVSIQENVENTFSLYPNPSSGEINIRFDSEIYEVPEISVYNNLGQMVYQEMLLAGQQNYSLNLQLPDGIYVLRVQLGDAVLTKKIVLNVNTKE